MNALVELNQHILKNGYKGFEEIEAVVVILDFSQEKEIQEGELAEEKLILKYGYTPEQHAKFVSRLEKLDYSNGFGCQFMSGTIWFRDGSWSERNSYDGLEWWEHRSRPELP